jgi:hypothetical protein
MVDVPIPLSSRTVPCLSYQLLTSNNCNSKVTQQKTNYVTTDGQSASLYWCQAAYEAQDQICVIIRQLWVCSCAASSLTRVRVRVTLRLAVYRKSVRLGDKSLETHDTVILFSK